MRVDQMAVQCYMRQVSSVSDATNLLTYLLTYILMYSLTHSLLTYSMGQDI